MKNYYPDLINKERYNGDLPIHLRSKYETDFYKKLDTNKNIKYWNSETIKIKYKFPYRLDKKYNIVKTKINKTRTYYIDFFYITYDNKYRLIEIKNMSLTKPPKHTKNKKSYNYALFNYIKNTTKFEAVNEYLKQFNDIDIKFIVCSGYKYNFET